MMGKNKGFHGLAFLLLFVSGLNWLAVGLFQWDLGSLFGGQGAIVSRVIYVLVGLSAIHLFVLHKSECKTCDSKPMM